MEISNYFIFIFFITFNPMKKYIILTLLLFAALITNAQQTFTNAAPGTSVSLTERKVAGTTDSLNSYWFGDGGNKFYWMYTGVQQNIRFQRKLTFLNGLTTTGFNITLGGNINQQAIFNIGATNNMQWLRSDILSNFSQQNTGIFRINLTSFNNTTNNKLLLPVNVKGVTRFAFKTTADTLGVTVGNANSGASGAIIGEVGSYVTAGTAFHSLHFKSKPLGVMKSYPAFLGEFQVFYSDSTIVAAGDTLNGNNISTSYHMHDSPTSGFYSTFGLPNRGDGFNHTFYAFGVYKQNPALSTAHLDTAVVLGDDSVKLSDVATKAFFLRNKDANSENYIHSNNNVLDNLPTGTAANSVSIDAGGKLIKGTVVDTAFLHSSFSPYTGILMSYIGIGPGRKWAIYVDTSGLIASKPYLSSQYVALANGVAHVADISHLQVYNGAIKTIVVDDPVRGGIFNFSTTVIVPDSGIYILPNVALTGTWVRQINPATGVKAEWWPIDGSGSNATSTANTTYINAMYTYVNSKGVGTVSFTKAGVYKVRSITGKSGVNLSFPTNFSYTSPTSTSQYDPVVMSIDSTAHVATMFNMAGCINVGFEGLAADGMRSDSTLVTSCIVGDNVANGVRIAKVKIYNFKYGVDGGTSSNWNICENSVFRENSQNLRNLTDSKVLDTWLIGARDKSVYLNTAQVQFIGCHTEFNRGGVAKTTSVPDFYFDGNAARILVSDCTSDRSAGSFAIITSSGSNVPYEIHFVGNHIKRVAWGTDLSNANQIAIKITGANGVSITGNHFYGYDYGSSTAKGVWSPRYVVSATGCTHLTVKSNFNDVKQRIDLSMPTAGQNTGTKYTWKAYPPVSNVYILTLPTASSADSSAYIGSPDQLDYDHGYMTAGTLATLAAGQYAYTTGAGYATGYTTLFAHFTNNRNPITQPIPLDSLYAEYQNLPYNIDNTNKWVETDGYQDYNPSIATTAGGTSTLQLHLSQPMQNNSQQLFTLQLVGRETTTATRNASNVQFSINKAASTAYPTVTLNNITQTVTGYTTAISGATGLVVTSITTDGIGSMITVTLTNNEANTVTVSAGIPVIASSPDSQVPANKMPALTGDVTTSAGAVATTIKTNVALAGSPTTTTQSAADASTKIATTAFVTAADNLKANIASPTFTGKVTLPTSTNALAGLVLPTGVLLTTPVSGSIENDGNSLYWTTGAGARQTVATLGQSQTFTNKNINNTSDVLGGVTMGIGSDAVGDMYYGGASNVLTRLPIGSTGQVLKVVSGSPSWGAQLAYLHTIFTPTTGGTVNLVNNQYNIINPAGALLALTVNLPSSPANNDVVYIKFTQNVTTVTYTGGTVVDGITAPSAGGLTVLTYDSGTTSWY